MGTLSVFEKLLISAALNIAPIVMYACLIVPPAYFASIRFRTILQCIGLTSVRSIRPMEGWIL